MEKAINCENCGSVNLIENCNEDFSGSCHHCGTLFSVLAEGITKNTIVAERYQVRDFLSEDNLSNIYFAVDLTRNELVILRVFCWDYSYSISSPEEFLHMDESISLLAQPGHVEIIDWGIDDDLMFTVWPGDSIESLTRVMQTHHTFEPGVAVSVIKEVAVCLSYTFDEIGVGHYSLNPNNIYLDSRGNVKISELGFAAQLFKDENFLDSGVEFYDWRYQAPEIVLDWYNPDIRSDMFALGMCMFTMITGEAPFDRMRPVSQVEYERLGFTRADQYRLGETFMDLFHGLTATNPSERFHSWKDAINFMDYFLQEERLIDSSAVSGRRRSMTTSFDLDILRETDNRPPIKLKTGKQRRKAMSASDIRNQSSFHVSEQPRKMKGKTIRPFASKKKTKDNPMPIIIGVVAALFAVVLVIMAAQSQNENDKRPGSDNTIITSSPKNNTPKKKDKDPAPEITTPPANVNPEVVTKPPVKPVQTEDTVTKINAVPNPEGNKDNASALNDFNDLVFQMREFTIRKDWDGALALLETYNGPLQDRKKALKEEIVRKRLAFLENQMAAKEAEKDKMDAAKKAEEQKPIEGAESATLEALAQRIYAGNAEAALVLLPLVETVQKVNLSLIKAILQSADEASINTLIAENYTKLIGKDVEIKIDGTLTKGQIRQVLAEEASLKMNVVFLTRQLERIYKFDQIDPLENVKCIVKNDLNETVLLQFMYLVRKRQFKAAQQTLLKYGGPLKKELLQTMEQYKNEEAMFAWNKLLTQLGLDTEIKDNDFVEALSKVKITDDDCWVFHYNLKDYVSRFSTTGFYQERKHLSDLTVRLFEKRVKLMKAPDAVVSDTARPGTVSIDSALRDIGDGGSIRLLPGFYKGSYSINNKIKVLGSSGVYFSGPVAITTDRVELKNIILEDGFIDIYRKVRDIKISRCEIRKGGIIMRGDNSNVEIDNSVMYGLKVGKNRQTVITDSVILEDNVNRYTINGFVSGPITNSIIRSRTEYAVHMDEKVESTLSLRYCMIFGLKGICYINKERVAIQGENDFNRKAGRAMQLKISQPEFVDEENFDFRLKDFSPGFFEGENKKCIGVQYNYTKK